MEKLSITRALTFAKMSAFAYPDNGDIITNLATVGYALVKEIGDNEHGVSGYIARNADNEHVLVFKGTSNASNVLTDIDALWERNNRTMYHSGFIDAYKKLLPEFEEFLPEYTTLYVTGHSLGGALAAITALNLYSFQFNACYTFGQPRVTNYSGEKLDQFKSIYRVVNGCDPVPGIPPVFYWPFIGELVFIDGGNLYTGLMAHVMRAKAIAFPLIKQLFGKEKPLKEHAITSYIDELSRVK